MATISQQAARQNGITGIFRILKDAVTKTATGDESARIDIDPADAEVTLDQNTGTPKKPRIVTRSFKVKRLVRRLNKAADLEKQIKAEKEFYQEAMRLFTETIRDQEARAGNYVKSYRVLGGVGADNIQSAISVEQQDGASINGEEIVPLDVAGTPKEFKKIDLVRDIIVDKILFDDLFESTVNIGLRPELVKNAEKLRDLRDKLRTGHKFSDDEIRNIFYEETSWSVKPGFRQKLYTLSKSTTEALCKWITPFVDKIKDVSFKAGR